MDFIRPANGSRPIPEVLLTDPSTLIDEATVTDLARALYAAGISHHPEDSADTIIGEGRDYLFTPEEADLDDRLYDRAWALAAEQGFDPNGIWLHVFYEVEGIAVCVSCDSQYVVGPVGRCCDNPILKGIHPSTI